MARHPLPDVATATWLEADQAAEILEALADEMRELIPGPRSSVWTTARRTGQRAMLLHVSARAIGYRLRQAALTADQ